VRERISADSLIRWSTIAAVTALAVVAGWVSYIHAHDVVVRYGQHGAVSFAYPATSDGMIYSASMVLLDAARRRVKAHWIAWATLVLGILVTALVNFWAGFQHGLIASVVFAWPALALVLGYEMLMLIIRNAARQEQSQDHPQDQSQEQDRPPSPPVRLAPAVPETVPASVRFGGLGDHVGGAAAAPAPPNWRHTPRAIERRFVRELSNRQVPGIRTIKQRMNVGYDRAREYQAHLAGIAAGQAIDI
jgi:hypothetical protein